MRRWPLPTALAAAGVLAVVLIAVTGGSAKRSTGGSGISASADSLKPHPRVVIALAPGDSPPPAYETTYESPAQAQNFQPPSDAEVKRELRQLNVARVAGNGAYVNPLSQVGGLSPRRIDMGVDYGGAGPILALGNGTVFNTNGAGWPGGTFIGITLSNGPFAGLAYFVAEDVKPTVKVGDHVRAGQVIGVMFNGPAGIETGWASGRGQEPLAAALGQQNQAGDPGAWSSAAGLSFDRVLVSTGAPSGIPQGTQVHGKLPAQYP